MPLLARPDGVDLHWEATGEGPGVLICNTFNLNPLDELVSTLAESRRVVTFEPRGVGRSTREGPYDLGTGVEDAEALLEESGPVEVALGLGDGAHRAIRIADARPDLADRVVFTSTALGRPGDADAPGFSGSTEVLYALMGLMRRDYRSGLRQMMSGSAGGDEDFERERAEEVAGIVSQEAAVGYLEAWISAGSVDVARRLGSRLTVLAYPGNAWFPLETYESMRDGLTEACFELVEDGPMSRPDLAAQVLLRVSEPATG
jgi:pimeloyl-ACP methyl ester carboxylesterase